MLNYKNSCQVVKKFVKDKKIDINLKFYKLDIVKFNSKEKFDFIVSDAVFEHCKDFPKVIKKCRKLLKKNGVLYSSYGAVVVHIWRNHFSGRDDIVNGFNHLLLKKKNKEYFNKNVRSLEYELDKGGGGGVLVQKNLFSKLSGNEYMKFFSQNNFFSIKTYVEFCPIGYNLIKKNQILRDKLKQKYPYIDIENYYLKTHIVYLKKKLKKFFL